MIGSFKFIGRSESREFKNGKVYKVFIATFEGYITVMWGMKRRHYKSWDEFFKNWEYIYKK